MSRPANRLRIAMQKSGRLADPARNLLKQAGFQFRSDKDQLFCYGESCPIDLVLVRDDDIPQLVAENVCDLGIVGRNVLIEKKLEMKDELMLLFGSRLCQSSQQFFSRSAPLRVTNTSERDAGRRGS